MKYQDKIIQQWRPIINNIFFGGYSMRKILVLILGLYSGLYTTIGLHAMQNPTQTTPNIIASPCLPQGALECGYYAFYHASRFVNNIAFDTQDCNKSLAEWRQIRRQPTADSKNAQVRNNVSGQTIQLPYNNIQERDIEAIRAHEHLDDKVSLLTPNEVHALAGNTGFAREDINNRTYA